MTSATLPAPAAALAPAAPPDAPTDAPDSPSEDWEGFSRALPGQPGRYESYLAIQGMYCPACSLVVEEAIGKQAGVHAVQVNGATQIARVEWSPAAGKPSQWTAALQQAGYGALPAADQFGAAVRLREQRVLLWRWLVAGFCMMQVMMYAYPAYVAAPGEIAPDQMALLRWASWILSLPVLLFSCRPFFASAWRDLRARRIGMDVPVALGIAITFAASTAATFDPASALGAEVWYDSLTMFVFFLLSGRLLEQRLRTKTAGALEALARRLPEMADRVLPSGETERVPVRRLAPGDCIRVKPGESIPVDGVILEGETRVDEALLTGESTALARAAGDAVIAGSLNLSGTLLLRAERTGEETRFAQIVALMDRASVEKPAIAQLAERIASPFLAAVIVAAAGAAAWWWSTSPAHALGIAVAVLVVTCPCALSLATPAATLAAAGALARRGVLVRRLEALEAGAAVDTVVFDKTGTLTRDRMAVTATRTRDGVSPQDALALAAVLASHSLHPASRAIVAAHGGAPAEATGVKEHAGQGVEGRVRICGEEHLLRLGSAAFCAEPPAAPRASQVHLSDAQGWLASFDLDEALRDDALPAVHALQSESLRVELLSGDRAAAVRRLATRAGIESGFGGRTPEDKLAHVRGLQRKGHRVAMVGDGMNDGPVLACADLSIAMGQGAPVAQARSDFIVLGGQLAAVPLLLAQSRRTRRVVRQNLGWAFAYNLVCVPLALAGLMPPWLAGLGMAASSLVVVLNAARLARIPDNALTRG